jgi:hypothetical protein
VKRERGGLKRPPLSCYVRFTASFGFTSYELPPASAGGDVPSESASAEIKKKCARINKALAKAVRNYPILIFRLKPVEVSPTSG